MPFDPQKVPEGPAADLFYSGKTGKPITDEQWDIQKARLIEHNAYPFDTKEQDA
jgi:hypothetical protein